MPVAPPRDRRPPLPLAVKPTSTELWIRTDLETESFSGKIETRCDVTGDAPSVTLTASPDLTLLDVQLRVGGVVVPSAHDFNAGFEQLTIRPKEPLRIGDVVEVGISFESKLNGSMRGCVAISRDQADRADTTSRRAASRAHTR